MKKYAILVNTCDKYSDAWPTFFYLLSQTWKSDMPNIYLNTENKKCEIESVEVVTAGKIKPDCWGERLRNALSHVKEDYVLMMLEDFYYESPINIDVIDKCADAMEKDKKIMSFQLVPASEVYRGEVKDTYEEYEGFALRERKGTYTFIAGPTLWRKSDLIKLTRPSDTPWTWEWYGSFRTQLYGKKIYCWKSFDNPVFDYDIAHGGAIHGGKWVGYKMRELEEKYGIIIDMSKRDVVEDWIKDRDIKTQVHNKPSRSIWRKIVDRIKGKMNSLHRKSITFNNILYGGIRRLF